MGMDVIGRKPTSKTGKYFRNNVWWWHPLWDYIETVAPHLAQRVKAPHSNDGDGLRGSKQCIELAAILQNEIDTGKTATYATEYQQRLDAMPDEPCFCNGTSKLIIFKDGARAVYEDKWVSIYEALGQLEIARATNVIARGKRTDMNVKDAGCNACQGKGKIRPWATHYRFDVANVQAFANFVRDSGGFRIC